MSKPQIVPAALPDQKLIAAARGMLERAERGELQGFATVEVCRDKTGLFTAFEWTLTKQVPWDMLIGAATRLTARLVERSQE